MAPAATLPCASRRAGTDRHVIRGSLSRWPADGAVTLRLYGEPGDRLSLMRRTYPYREAFSRSGEAVCRQQDATS